MPAKRYGSCAKTALGMGWASGMGTDHCCWLLDELLRHFDMRHDARPNVCGLNLPLCPHPLLIGLIISFHSCGTHPYLVVRSFSFEPCLSLEKWPKGKTECLIARAPLERQHVVVVLTSSAIVLVAIIAVGATAVARCGGGN